MAQRRCFNIIDREIIQNAAEEYDGEKYPEVFYFYHLLVLQNAEQISELVDRAVRYLFLWKLGKVHLEKGLRRSQLKFSDTQGRVYYYSIGPEVHNRAISRATQKERLEFAFAFRDGRIDYNEFKRYAGELTSSTIVLPSFYVHIWRPFQYPVLDTNVWTIFRRQKGCRVSKRTQPRSWSHFEAYIPFFRDVVAHSGLDWRTVDRGLWVLGGRLNTTIEKQNTAELEDGEVATLDLNHQQKKSCFTPILPELMDKVCLAIRKQRGTISFRHRGIGVSPRLIKTTIELLNEEPTKMLPQNCRNDVRERTPDGLDRRIKERLNSDLRTANIISDVLADASVVEIIQIENARTGRMVKATRLLQEYCW